MDTWYDAARKYPHEGASAAIVLTYLSFGSDYPYRMSKLLKPHIEKIVDHKIDGRGLR
jgi:hypothetical protein